MAVADGDVAMAPRGHDLYHLYVMAGPVVSQFAETHRNKGLTRIAALLSPCMLSGKQETDLRKFQAGLCAMRNGTVTAPCTGATIESDSVEAATISTMAWTSLRGVRLASKSIVEKEC